MEICEEPIANLGEYSALPIAFTVETVLELEIPGDGLGGFVLRERRLPEPFVKDYDAIPGNSPAELSKRFDLAGWGLLMAREGGDLVGGALVTFGNHEVEMLDGRDDLAVIWDIRVAAQRRRQGVGSCVFSAAERWASSRGCRWLKVETQNINVPACRFYARQGCTLGAIHRFAYPELPNEVQLLWYKWLA